MRIKWLLLALVAVLLTGCMATAEREDGVFRIVVTDFPSYDFARAVVGDDKNITLLIKPGSEVHGYDPAPEDIVALMDADLFIYIGGESDVWADELLESLGDKAPRVARMFDGVEVLEQEIVEGMQEDDHDHDHDHEDDHDHDEDHEHEHSSYDEYDEHIWTSPKNAVRMVRSIEDTLRTIDPDNADAYTANANAYIAKIEELDAAFQNVVEIAARREFIFGDRFPFLYFAKEYGLTYYAAFPGCSSETEPSAQTISFLIDKVRADGVPAVYAIELSTGNIARTIAEETGAEVLTFHSVQNVTIGEFEAGETYVSLMWKNVAALEKGLN